MKGFSVLDDAGELFLYVRYNLCNELWIDYNLECYSYR